MPILKSDGTILDTGVAQESPAHQTLESQAHQEDSFPLNLKNRIDITLSWVTNTWGTPWNGSPPIAPFINRVSPGYDAVFYFGNSWQDSPSGYNASYDTGGVDSNGWEVYLPPPGEPSVVFASSGSNVWSCGASGNPHWLIGGPGSETPSGSPFGTIGSTSYGPLVAYCFDFGDSVTVNWRTYFKAGAYTFTLLLSDYAQGFAGNPNGTGMNNDFEGTFNFGPYQITFSMASGFSGTGVTANTLTGTAPNRQWTADLALTFAQNWQATNFAMGPMGIYSGNTNSQGGGAISIETVTHP